MLAQAQIGLPIKYSRQVGPVGVLGNQQGPFTYLFLDTQETISKRLTTAGLRYNLYPYL